MRIPQETSVGQSPTKPLVLVLLKQFFALLLMFSCSHVSPKKHVLLSPQKPCSSVLLSPPKKHVLLFSCLSKKNMFFCSHVFPKKHVLLSNSCLRGTVRRPYLLHLFLFPPNHPAQQSCLWRIERPLVCKFVCAYR